MVDTNTKTKEIIVSIAGSEGQREQKVKLLPGTTARDVLQSLKLNNYQLAKPEGGFYAMNDNLYEAVKEEGIKLFATPSKVEAGIA